MVITGYTVYLIQVKKNITDIIGFKHALQECYLLLQKP